MVWRSIMPGREPHQDKRQHIHPGQGPRMTLGGPAPSVSGFPAAGAGRSRPKSARTRRARANRNPQDGLKAGDRPRTPRTIRADATAAAGAAAGPVGRRSRGELTPRRRLRGVRATRGFIPSRSSLSVPTLTHPHRLVITPLDRQTAPTDTTAPFATRRMHRRRSVASAYISHTVAPTGHGPVFARF
jgi:hypothetical protein